LFLWQFDGFFRKLLEDFPLSSIFNTAGFVHSACTSTSGPNIKRLCNENTDLDNYILSSRVAPDTTDADVHALCTKPAVLKMEESGKSSMGFRNPRLHYTVNNVHITVGMIMEWHVSISCTTF
jgi:hypothetical protein